MSRHNRADVLAVIAVMQVHDGNLEIRSDSERAVHICEQPYTW